MEHSTKRNNNIKNINERKHVKCSGFFPWKSCDVNVTLSQGLLAAPAMIKTNWYFNDHLFNQNLSGTPQSCKIFPEQYIFVFSWSCAWLNDENKNRNLKRWSIHPRQNIQMRQVEPNGKTILLFPISFGLDCCLLYIWHLERPKGKLVPHYTRCKGKKPSNPFLDSIKRPQMIDRWLFLLKSKRNNACSGCG